MKTPEEFDSDQEREGMFSGFVKSTMARFFLVVLVWIITMSFGLVPYGNYEANWVSVSDTEKGIRFGDYGLAYGPFPKLSDLKDTNNNLEIKLGLRIESAETDGFQVIIYLGTLDDEQPLILGQWRNYIVLMQGYDFANELSLPRLTVDIGGKIGEGFELRVLLNDNRNTMYLNGEPVSTHSPSSYVVEKDTLTISVGNTLDGKLGWAGVLDQFVVEHQNTVTIESTLIADYDLAQIGSDGRIINIVDSEYDLMIPEVGRFPKTLFLNDRKVENLFNNSPFDLFINFIGFVPLALCLAVLLRRLWSSTPAICSFVLLIGGLTTLSIEYSQQYIPGRNSDLHDLILNLMGVLAGLAFYLIIDARIKEKSGQILN